MTPEIWSVIGSWSLYTLIGFGLASLVVSAIRKQWKVFVMIALCFASVIGCEIWSFISEGRSVSTGFGVFLASDPIYGWLWIAFFSLSMASLVLHFIAYAFKRKKK